MNHLVTYPFLRASRNWIFEGVPADCATMVAAFPACCPIEATVRDLDSRSRDPLSREPRPNLYFALSHGCALIPTVRRTSGSTVAARRKLIRGLNRRYPEAPFFLFHRRRVYNDSESRWMGWERKRGKLLDLNRLMRGGFDAFPVKVGRLDVLPGIRYVITLDSDTQLPRDSAAKLIGAIAHPLNAAVLDPEGQIVTEGYGILQPRIGVSIRSAARSRLAALYSGETGFDIYTRAVSDVYQDLFAEGSFTGKGIYEVDVMCAVLERRFPENALLSHDLIEGAYARVGLASDIELIDDYPSHFSAYNRRKHRWVRGDWQILRWLFNRVPDYERKLVSNPISLISRWEIFDNLRRSLLDQRPSSLLGGWFVPACGYWQHGHRRLLLPVYCDLLFALCAYHEPGARSLRDSGHRLAPSRTDTLIAMFGLVFLLYQALLRWMPSHAPSPARVHHPAETAGMGKPRPRPKPRQAARRRSTHWNGLPWIGILLALLVWGLRPAALPAAAPVLALWIGSRGFSAWLNRAPRTMNRALKIEDREWLRGHAEKICRYFQDWSSASTNWLIPDSVREDGAVALRFSPTNLGMLLNARIAALQFGVMNLSEFIAHTRQTLDRVISLSKYRGHLFNWYVRDAATLSRFLFRPSIAAILAAL